jgi:hypothetical protein
MAAPTPDRAAATHLQCPYHEAAQNLSSTPCGARSGCLTPRAGRIRPLSAAIAAKRKPAVRPPRSRCYRRLQTETTLSSPNHCHTTVVHRIRPFPRRQATRPPCPTKERLSCPTKESLAATILAHLTGCAGGELRRWHMGGEGSR